LRLLNDATSPDRKCNVGPEVNIRISTSTVTILDCLDHDERTVEINYPVRLVNEGHTMRDELHIWSSIRIRCPHVIVDAILVYGLIMKSQ